jgi:signal transduction histidine kinase
LVRAEEVSLPGSVCSVSVQPFIDESLARPTNPSESGVTRLVAWSFLLAVVLAVVADTSLLEEAVRNDWPNLIFWLILLIVMNLLPVEAERLRLTLDVPLTLAVAFLYRPPVAAVLAGIAAFDTRELTKQISASRAAFNRAQIATSVYLASSVFHGIAPGPDRWYVVVAGTVAALLVDYSANSLMVMLFERLNSGVPMTATLRRLKVGRTVEFLLTYLGYGLLALAIASIYQHEGPWAVAVFLIPILVARQLLVRNQELHAATMKLRTREILLERLLHGVVDERRDERARVAADLHDDVLQGITRVRQVASTLLTRGSAGSLRRDIEQLNEATEYSLLALREVMRNLRDSPLGARGLLQTIRGFTREVQIESGVRVELDLPGSVDASPEAQLVIFLVIREGVRNAIKHADASVIRIAVEQVDDVVALRVEDNGIGFDPALIDVSSHFGLQLTRERLELIGGLLLVESRKGSGTTLSARAPRERSLQ